MVKKADASVISNIRSICSTGCHHPKFKNSKKFKKCFFFDEYLNDIHTKKTTSLKCVIYIVKNMIHRKKRKKIKKISVSVDFLNQTHGNTHWIWYERGMLDGEIFSSYT